MVNAMYKRITSLVLVIVMLSTNLLIGCSSNRSGSSQLISTENSLSVLCGGSSISYADGPLDEAAFGLPRGICLEGDQLYITDYDTNYIRCLDKTAGTVTTLFEIENPTAIGIYEGTIYVGTDESLFRYENGQTVDVLAGREIYAGLDVDGYAVGDIETVKKGLYFTDTANNCVLFYNPSEDSVSVIAGQAGTSGYADGTASVALFREPIGLCYQDKTLYIADSGNNCIRSLKNEEVTTFAGTVEEIDEITGRPTGTDGTGFNYPTGLCMYHDMLIVCDSLNNKIKGIDENGQVIALFGDKAGCTEGTGTDALVNVPWNVCANETYFYLTDCNSNAIREGYLYDTSENTVETQEDFESVTTRIAAVFELSEGGSYQVVRGSKEIEPYAGMRLAAGDTVSCSSGDIYIQIDEDKIFRLTDQSSITISEAKKDALVITLQKGQMFFNIQEKIPDDQNAEFIAGATTMAVRGTAGLFKEILHDSKHEDEIVEENKDESEFIRTVTLYLLSGKIGISFGNQYEEEKLIVAGQYFDSPEETLSCVIIQEEEKLQEEAEQEAQGETQEGTENTEHADEHKETPEEEQTEEIIEIHDMPQEELEEVITEVAKELDNNLQQRIISDMKDAGSGITEAIQRFIEEVLEKIQEERGENQTKKENEKRPEQSALEVTAAPKEKTTNQLNIVPSNAMIRTSYMVGQEVTLTDFIGGTSLTYKNGNEDVTVNPTDCTYAINGTTLTGPTFRMYYSASGYTLTATYQGNITGSVSLNLTVATMTELSLKEQETWMKINVEVKAPNHFQDFFKDSAVYSNYLIASMGGQTRAFNVSYVDKYITKSSGSTELIPLSSDASVWSVCAESGEVRAIVYQYNYYGQILEWQFPVILNAGTFSIPTGAISLTRGDSNRIVSIDDLSGGNKATYVIDGGTTVNPDRSAYELYMTIGTGETCVFYNADVTLTDIQSSDGVTYLIPSNCTKVVISPIQVTDPSFYVSYKPDGIHAIRWKITLS